MALTRARAGSSGLAHVRYPTAGTASAKEAQPFYVNSPLGIFLIHNGNLTNTPQLRDELKSSSSFFDRMLRTPSDSETLLNVFADEIHRAHQACIREFPALDPNERKMQFVQEAGAELMQARPPPCDLCMRSHAQLTCARLAQRGTTAFDRRLACARAAQDGRGTGGGIDALG